MTEANDLLARLRAKMTEQQQSWAAGEAKRKHREYIEQQVRHALIANLRLWLDMNNMHELPEAFTTKIVANTGFQGGDAGHGGKLAIEFKTDSGCNAIVVSPTVRAIHGDGVEGAVVLIARGDWEQHGLISGLASLLRQLLEVDGA